MAATANSTAIFFIVLLIAFHRLPTSTQDSSDEACLNDLRNSLQDTAGNLRNWTKSTVADPCSGFNSYLQGVTCNNGRVYKLSLAGLSLAGTIPAALSNCSNLQSLDLSSNRLTGSIPPEIQWLLNLAVLNLSSNQLSGTIPPELTACLYLNVIDLHGNSLTGSVPQQLGLLTRLSTFDVSDNRLSGPVPALLANRSGGLPRFNASSFEGNKDMYGYPLPPAGGRGLSILAIVGIGLGSGLLSLVISFAVVCLWLRVSDHGGACEEEGKISHPDY